MTHIRASWQTNLVKSYNTANFLQYNHDSRTKLTYNVVYLVSSKFNIFKRNFEFYWYNKRCCDNCVLMEEKKQWRI